MELYVISNCNQCVITSNSNRQQILIIYEFAVDLRLRSSDFESCPEQKIVSEKVEMTSVEFPHVTLPDCVSQCTMNKQICSTPGGK